MHSVELFSINNITFKINADGMSLVMNNSRMTKHFFKTEQKKNVLIKGHVRRENKAPKLSHAKSDSIIGV